MEPRRRKFLKVAGFSVLGLVVRGPLAKVAAAADRARPTTGKRWGMAIDPRRCLDQQGCSKCVTACHDAHNVPSMPNPRHEVKWVWKEDFRHAFPDLEVEHVDERLTSSPVLVLCNHCDNPPCVRVCPTQATFRRDDGIVMMDWHRCIGCRYCVAACPYGSRSFNYTDPRPHLAKATLDFPTRSRGVVEKCTLCEERIVDGKPPACVEACEARALVFGDLNDASSEVRQTLRGRFALRRKPHLGTRPAVYYLV